MLDKLDTAGGHIAVCIGLLFIGAGFYVGNIPKSEDIIIFALGVLARSMMDAQKK